MCDLETIYGILLGANIALIASIVACGVAIGLNLGFFSAPAAPAVFTVALFTGIAAAVALIPVTMMLGNCATGQCSATATDAALLIGTASGSLAAGLIIAYIAILTSAVPVAGAGTMAAYAVFLVMAAAFLMQGIMKLRELQTCLSAPFPSTDTAVVVTGGVALFLSLAGGVIYGLLSIGSKPSNNNKPDK